MFEADQLAAMREMLGAPPLAVRGEWHAPLIASAGETTVRSLTIGLMSTGSGLVCSRAKCVLACAGPGGEPEIVGVAMRSRSTGLLQRGFILLGDTSASVSVRDGQEEVQFESGIGARRTSSGLGVLWSPYADYRMDDGQSVRIQVPRLFSTNGVERWQFHLAHAERGRVWLRALAVPTYRGTMVSSEGCEVVPEGSLATTDPAGFAVRHRITRLGTPLFSEQAARAMADVGELLRRVAVMAAVWERLRFEGPDGGT